MWLNDSLRTYFPYLSLFNSRKYLTKLTPLLAFFLIIIFGGISANLRHENIRIIMAFVRILMSIPVILILPFILSDQNKYSLSHFFNHTNSNFKRDFSEVGNIWLITCFMYIISYISILYPLSLSDLPFIILILISSMLYTFLYSLLALRIISSSLNVEFDPNAEKTPYLIFSSTQLLRMIFYYFILVTIVNLESVTILGILSRFFVRLKFDFINASNSTLNFGGSSLAINQSSFILSMVVFDLLMILTSLLVLFYPVSREKTIKSNYSLQKALDLPLNSEKLNDNTSQIQIILRVLKNFKIWILLYFLTVNIIPWLLFQNNSYIHAESYAIIRLLLLTLSLINSAFVFTYKTNYLKNNQALWKENIIYLGAIFTCLTSITYLYLIAPYLMISIYLKILIYLIFIVGIFSNLIFSIYINSKYDLLKNKIHEKKRFVIFKNWNMRIILIIPIILLIDPHPIVYSLFFLSLAGFYTYSLYYILKKYYNFAQTNPILQSPNVDYFELKPITENDFTFKLFNEELVSKWLLSQTQCKSALIIPKYPPYCLLMTLEHNLRNIFAMYKIENGYLSFIEVSRLIGIEFELQKEVRFISHSDLYLAVLLQIMVLKPEEVFIQNIINYSQNTLGKILVEELIEQRVKEKLYTYYS